MVEIFIRPLTHADLADVLELERRVFPTPWSLGMFAMELAKEDGIYLAAMEGSTLVGYLICSPYDGDWHLMNIAVSSEMRRTGIAKMMIEEMLERSGNPAAARFTLEVRHSNLGAISLYKHYGFHEVGVRRRYYQDTGEDAYIMWRSPGTLDGTLSDIPNARRDVGER